MQVGASVGRDLSLLQRGAGAIQVSFPDIQATLGNLSKPPRWPQKQS